MDYIEKLGALVLDHRFKRMMNRLLSESERIYKARGLDFKPRWASTTLLLSQEGPLSISEIASRLRVTHPAIIKIASDMEQRGLVSAEVDPIDGRKRLLRLSPQGKSTLQKLQPIWRELAAVQEELFRTAGCDILLLLGRVEQELEEQSILQRVLLRLEGEDSTHETQEREAENGS